MTTWRASLVYVCDECDEQFPETSLLIATSPFDPDDILHGCPNCHAVNRQQILCFAENCPNPATCGGWFEDGLYRSTCSNHTSWLNRPTGIFHTS